MKINKQSMLLYVVTDRTWLGENSLISQIEDTIKEGATFVQLREKSKTFDEFVYEAAQIKKLTDRYGIPFVINDDIEVALAVNADGVHIGQSDKGAMDVRNLIGNNKIMGVSAITVEQAILAEQCGADYIGVGAMFATQTKQDADTVTFDTLKQICQAVSIPVVAIGGICEENIMQLKGCGMDGVAIISAIFAKSDIRKATESMRKLSQKIVGN